MTRPVCGAAWADHRGRRNLAVSSCDREPGHKGAHSGTVHAKPGGLLDRPIDVGDVVFWTNYSGNPCAGNAPLHLSWRDPHT